MPDPKRNEANNDNLELHKEDTEEDWSSLLVSGDDLLSSYEEEIISVLPNHSLKLKHITDRQLSPLDVVSSHSSQDHDATGHHIWLASYFFLDAMVRPVPEDKVDLLKTRTELFSQKRVLELGCGTGVASLALIVASSVICEDIKIVNLPPKELIMTDADPDALELCEMNLSLNNFNESNDSIFIKPLTWGTKWWDDESKCDEQHESKGSLLKEAFDTAFAADVVYDLEALPPLMKTVSEALSHNGNFILSHVPRFASTSVEALIVQSANSAGLSLVREWRPSEIYDSIGQKKDVMGDMEEKNAVMFLFNKC